MLQYGGENTSKFLIRGARQLLTLREQAGSKRENSRERLGIIGDGAVLVRDGVIQEVGMTRRLENVAGARDAIEINAAGRLVMPGFIDSHTHLGFPLAGRRTDQGDGGIRALLKGSTSHLSFQLRPHVEAMARHGTTTVEVKTGCGPDEIAETKLLRVLHEFRNGPVDVVPTFFLRLTGSDLEGAHDAAAEWVASELLPKIRRRRLAVFADLAWNTNPTAHNRFSRYLQIARRLGFACKIHADRVGAGAAIRMALDHLVVSIDHLEYASAGEAALLAGGSTVATLMPAADFCHRVDFAPARALLDAGVAVALATDFNPKQSPGLSMQAVVALACRHLKMTPEEALISATINGARALRLADRTGSLEPGKHADILILNIADYRELARHLGDNLVRLTMKRGEVVYREGDVASPAGDQLLLSW